VAQNITITGVARNRRIERAIPQLMARLGMAKDQATAVAIRLESIGRLQVDGAPVDKPKSTRGLPIAITPLAAAMAVANMKKDRSPRQTVVRETMGGDIYRDPFEASRDATQQSTRANRLRRRVTRGRS